MTGLGTTTPTPMNEDAAHLARRLAEVVRAVPGVEALYSSGSIASTVTDAALAQLPVVRAPRHPLSVTEVGGRVAVSAVIGIGANHDAAAVCRGVYDAIAGHLATGDRAVSTVEVRVGSIG